ncbi:MAG: septum formation initiator family protein [Candidatus Rokubacteria bacterium]|nr:septum formation initiator family protein [Candidatus Rokubacteria bacterium]MBI3824920.1 septum formation initiator family protein [Candidatus Rokubacteria bacterium]
MTRARLLAIALAVVIVAGLALFAGSALARVRQMRYEMDALQRDIDGLRVRAATLTATIEAMRHDPAYLEKVAREEHGLVRPQDTVIKFPKSATGR